MTYYFDKFQNGTKQNTHLESFPPLPARYRAQPAYRGRACGIECEMTNSANGFIPKSTPFTRRARNMSLWVNLVIILATTLLGLTTLGDAFAAPKAGENDQPVLELANLVRPNDLNSGGLLLPSKRPGFYVQAPRLATDVNIDVSGPIARTIVTQRFENPSQSWVEGTYVFPLPEDSAVDTLKMQIGERFIEGIVKPKKEARKIYEKAKAEGKKAALLEQQRPNIFTNEVANIGPGETIVVQIEYQTTIKQDNDLFSLRFPMVVAPRFNPKPIIQSVRFEGRDKNSPWATMDPVPDRYKITSPVLDPEENAKINPVTLTINLAAGFELGDIESEFHTINITAIDDRRSKITLQNKSVPADRDFVLKWKAKNTTPNAALFSETVDGQTYILAFVTPPVIKPKDLPKKDRETIFILDNSGSMAGESMVQAKLALANALARLTPADKFNIVRFDDTHEQLFPAAVLANRENVSKALGFVKNIEAEGGTLMLPALQMALVDHTPNDYQRVRQVIFITDGAIGNESELFDEIAANRGRSRVFTIGIGSAPNSHFMTRAAEIGRGTFTHIGAVNQVTDTMTKFFEKLENPVLTGLRAEAIGGDLSDVSPNPLPDLYMGEPIVLAAKTSNLNSKLTISGNYANQPWQVNMDLAKSVKGSGIGKLWARRKIAALEVSTSRGADQKKVDAEIEAVALQHHLVSRMTSLVAVDVTKSRPDSENLVDRKLPHNLPKGWVFDKVFDEPDAADQPSIKTRSLRKQQFTQTAMLLASAKTPDQAALVAKTYKRALTLPQTATPAERNIIIGLLLVLITLVLAAIGKMWQQTSQLGDHFSRRSAARDYAKLPW